ncbi:MAG TPA: Rieske 2Fe-2S domain-containing protein, partial [Flavitalea sp.]|nr:Rieske 2Fe-2S domain-containing protein [Flavitalea sp.]
VACLLLAMMKKYEWHKIAECEEEIVVGENGIAVFEIRNKKICITKYREEWFGFPYTCPHAGGILAGGYIDKIGNIVCPLHGYKFGLKNGRNSSGEGFYMRTFPIEIRPTGLFVGLDREGLFGIFS